MERAAGSGMGDGDGVQEEFSADDDAEAEPRVGDALTQEPREGTFDGPSPKPSELPRDAATALLSSLAS